MRPHPASSSLGHDRSGSRRIEAGPATGEWFELIRFGLSAAARHPRHRVDILAEDVTGDCNLAGGEDFASTVGGLRDDIRSTSRVLDQPPVHDLGLTRIRRRGRVVDTILNLLVVFDRAFVAQDQRPSRCGSARIPKVPASSLEASYGGAAGGLATSHGSVVRRRRELTAQCQLVASGRACSAISRAVQTHGADRRCRRA